MPSRKTYGLQFALWAVIISVLVASAVAEETYDFTFTFTGSKGEPVADIQVNLSSVKAGYSSGGTRRSGSDGKVVFSNCPAADDYTSEIFDARGNKITQLSGIRIDATHVSYEYKIETTGVTIPYELIGGVVGVIIIVAVVYGMMMRKKHPPAPAIPVPMILRCAMCGKVIPAGEEVRIEFKTYCKTCATHIFPEREYR